MRLRPYMLLQLVFVSLTQTAVQFDIHHACAPSLVIISTVDSYQQ